MGPFGSVQHVWCPTPLVDIFFLTGDVKRYSALAAKYCRASLLLGSCEKTNADRRQSLQKQGLVSGVNDEE
jgi:hypothetical protein